MIKLVDFLNKLFSPPNGDPQPVYIYDYSSAFDPNDESKQCLIAVHRSDYDVKYIYGEKFCNSEIREIYWSERGIILTVDMR